MVSWWLLSLLLFLGRLLGILLGRSSCAAGLFALSCAIVFGRTGLFITVALSPVVSAPVKETPSNLDRPVLVCL